jgi:phosphoserine phosphatase
VVRERADTNISVPYLDAILFIMGIRRQHVEDADASDPEFSAPDHIEVPGIPPV